MRSDHAALDVIIVLLILVISALAGVLVFHSPADASGVSSIISGLINILIGCVSAKFGLSQPAKPAGTGMEVTTSLPATSPDTTISTVSTAKTVK